MTVSARLRSRIQRWALAAVSRETFEPFARGRVEVGLNLVGGAFSGFSTLLCDPGSVSRPGRARVALAPGAQAGGLISDFVAHGDLVRFPCGRDPGCLVCEVRR
jgi:hypothetical protein